MGTTYNSNFYDIKVTRINGINESLEKYKNKVILVVNTASECGLTPQYKGLEKLYMKYKDSGFVILGFPCNQFGGQEPGNEEQIQNSCLLNYGVSFPMYSKTKVNGHEAHPLFKYLKSELKGLLGSKIKWNFTKFLIDARGFPVKRFGPTITPEKIEGDILKLLKDNPHFIVEK